MTMLNRATPDADPTVAITPIEMKLLDHLLPKGGPSPSRASTLSDYLTKIARLGGYPDRAHDPPPGNTVMWLDLSRLIDIRIGAAIEPEFVDN
ncbi:hypothetical protein [Rhizobium terrae]|uniref:hypothetical protein n=1 Tax=Rhizobium terrae TaxID=2171756 RepID=UPI000E3BA303|nr:hypothetical protein [Rhizobium terrae]